MCIYRLCTSSKLHPHNCLLSSTCTVRNLILHIILLKEKDAGLSDDYGKDLASVQALQRKHEGFERDLAALKNKITTLSQECERLSSTYPESSPRVRGKEREVVQAWEALLTRSEARKDKLVEAEQLQRYLNSFRDLR